MLNKNLFILCFLMLGFVYTEGNAYSAVIPEIKNNGQLEQDIEVEECTDSSCREADIIKKVALRDKIKRSPEAQINAFFKKFNKCTMSNNIEKIKEFYTDSYLNNDGFDKSTITDMMKVSADAYKNVKFETNIESIKITGDYAVVQIKEIARGETAKKLDKVDGTGSITSEIYYTDYLQRINNKWKISATDVSYEKLYLKYGEAKYMDIDITAPDCVPAGSDYEVSIKTILPGGSFVVGSIVNEEIVYPQQNKKDVYRAIKSDELARILKSNVNNHNEYATASIAITRANVTPPAVMLDMTGTAFVMKRVNVLSNRNDIKNKE